MSQNLPPLLFVDAMVGATAYVHPFHEDQAHAPSAAAMDHVRQAQVDIYCSHNAQAISAIREARRELRTSTASGVAPTLLALDEAAWFTRHNEYLRAEEALETALEHMRAMIGRSGSAKLS